MSTTEALCDVLEAILLNDGSIEFERLRKATGLPRLNLSHYLDALEACGFVERGPQGSRVGARLSLILTSRRAAS